MPPQPTILYEDDNMLAVNKPAGLVVHSDGKKEETTLCDWLIEKFPDMKGVGEPLVIPGNPEKGKEDVVIDRPGIVHRLDRDTSGVMLVAKNQDAYSLLKMQFQERTIVKKYHAFVYGSVKEDEGVIDRPIGRSAKDFRLKSAQRFARGDMRDAITEYKVFGRSKEVSFVEANPKTGRTHQIRVHFKAINHSVVADPLYAPKRPPLLEFERLALHAFEISFALPTISGDEKRITIRAPYPADFLRAIEIFKDRATIVGN